jgi:signal transduction histidine kinase
VSIKRLLVVASVAVVMLLAGSTALSLYVFSTAELRLERALRSYEQLAIATGLEADAVRAVLAEQQRRSGTASGFVLAFDPAAVSNAIDALIAGTREEISSTGDEEERATEAEEFVAAFAIREDYARLLRLMEAQRGRSATLGPAELERYRALDRRLGDVVAGEREEVAAALAGLSAFRVRLQGYASAALVAVVLVITGAALSAYRLLMKPLRVLESGSAQLAAGNIEYRIEEVGPPELQRLAARLNDMAARLEEQRNALRRSNEVLEETVAERTAELADKADSLQRIDESRRLFFAKVGHELRTPLAVLLGEAEVALAAPRPDAEQYRDALEHIGVHGEQLRRRVADLLALARSEDGRLAISRAEVDLVDLSRETIDATRGFARVQEVQLRLRSSATSLPACVDADRLRQALMALIDNAVKFSPPGGDVELSVEAFDASRPGAEGSDAQAGIRLEVRDRGPGVAEEDLARIAQPYFQGDAPVRAGTGLGLAVAHWVAEQHGGRLAARNRDGAGLAVALCLPAECRTPAATDATVAAG